MSELALIKEEHFGEIPCDFYGKDDEVYMTISQLAECLGYADRSGVQKIVDRNQYLNNPEFSCWDNLSHESGAKKTRLFTEDGIYEVTMLARTERAKEFRGWVRRILKGLRKGEVRLTPMTEYQPQRLNAETRERNARERTARLLAQMARKYKGTAAERALDAYAVRELTGEFVLPPAARGMSEAQARLLVASLSYDQKVKLNGFLKKLEAERTA